MIHDLSIYRDWKRFTLDRLTNRYVSRIESELWSHLLRLKPIIERAIESKHEKINLPADHIEDFLEDVFWEHQYKCVYVGVSDGMREVTPEKKFATYLDYPIDIPVEKTFTGLAVKQRNSIFDKVMNKLNEKNAESGKYNAGLVKKEYLDLLKGVFKDVADDYYSNPESNTPRSVVNEIIKNTFKKSKTHVNTIVRTETTRYFNEARQEYFSKHTDTDFIQLIAITDGRTSEICEKRDFFVLPIGKSGVKKYKPPFHPNCRTVQSPLDTDIKRNEQEVRDNLGAEFGTVISPLNGKKFTGRRQYFENTFTKKWG